MFSGSAPTGTNDNIPAPNPFISLGETYYNSSTYQLISLGPDSTTVDLTSGGSNYLDYHGTSTDDITNFGY
jgi:hypothetical protein